MSENSVEIDDDPIDLEQLDRFATAFAARLATKLTPVFENVFNKFAEDFDSVLDRLLEKRFTDLTVKSSEAQSPKLLAIESENDQRKSKLEGIKRYQRLDNRGIQGLIGTPMGIVPSPESGSAPSTSPTHRSTIQSIQSKILAIESENDKCRSKLEGIEHNQHLDNLIIHGLIETPTGIIPSAESGSAPSSSPTLQSAIQSVLDLCTMRLHLPISEADISYAYRIPGNGKNLCRPLVVRFVSRRIRDQVYASRKTLRDGSDPRASTIYINEHLTRTNAQIYAKARGLVRARKIHSTWTAGGCVFIRQSASRSEKPKRVSSLSILEHL